MIWRRLVPAVAVLGLGAGAFTLWSGWDTTAVPVVRVERGDFVHEIQVEGMLRAETATPLTVPRLPRSGPMKLAWTAPDGSRVEKDDVVVRFDATELEKELHAGQADRKKAVNRRRQKEVEEGTALENLERDAHMAELQLEHSRSFQSTDTELYSRTEIIESAIDQELATQRKEHATESRALRQRSGRVELELLDLQRERADIAIERAEAGLDALEIRAPHDGIFVLTRRYGYAPQVGEQVYPGQPIGELPQLDRMKAVVYVLEADAGGVEPGVPARVVLESHPRDVHAGRVRNVAAVATRRTRYSPVQYFEVEVELERTDAEIMKPGQRVRATLVLQDQEDVITVPRDAVFRDATDQRIVHRASGGEFEPVVVELGATALGRVVVRSGLSEGDVIALVDPDRPLAVGAREQPATGSGPLPTGSGS